MKTYKEFLQINEALITFGNKAFPKFNNIVILAGGAASGKGFILSKLLGIDGKVFDVDQIKSLAQASTVFSAKVKEETGSDIKNFDMTDPKNVSTIHKILSGIYKLDKKFKNTLYTSVLTTNPKRKPNLIFDMTLREGFARLSMIVPDLEELGYDKKNIHIVWVINSVELALKQNKDRERIVPEEILLNTHQGASTSMKQIITNSEKLKKYMDGDIWFVFNNRENSDIKLKTSDLGGSYILKGSQYFKIKSQGKTAVLSKNIADKIVKYVPKPDVPWDK